MEPHTGLRALLSAEAEYMAMVQEGQAGLQLGHFLSEMGIDFEVVIITDSNAARGAAEKKGVLHMKHLAMKEHFLKELVDEGVLRIERTPGKLNVADALAKLLRGTASAQCLRLLPAWVFHKKEELQ